MSESESRDAVIEHLVSFVIDAFERGEDIVIVAESGLSTLARTIEDVADLLRSALQDVENREPDEEVSSEQLRLN